MLGVPTDIPGRPGTRIVKISASSWEAAHRQGAYFTSLAEGTGNGRCQLAGPAAKRWAVVIVLPPPPRRGTRAWSVPGNTRRPPLYSP